MRRQLWPPATALLLLLLATLAPAGDLPDIAREDIYLRESLVAIRDWETILGLWTQSAGDEAAIPLLPVPADGTAVSWPNPIPRLLLPAEDLRHALSVQFADGRLQVTRGEGEPELAAADKPVTAYVHPGGGGKDHWYHAYTRRFDGLLRFSARPSPFSLSLAAPCAFARGRNELAIGLRNHTTAELEVAVGLELWTTGGQRSEPTRRCRLAPAGSEVVHISFELGDEGGTLLAVTPECNGSRYLVPLLAHVESVSAVLRSLDEILQDSPDAEAQGQLVLLRGRAKAWTPTDGGECWRQLFLDAGALRERLLLGRVGFDTLLLAKRRPYDSEQPYMDAHHLHNPPGGGIYRLSPVRPDGVLAPVVESLGEGIYRDLCLHWDATRLVFSFGNGSDNWDGGQSYHIYEVKADGGDLRRLTTGARNDCEPFYLPGGQVGFTSDRGEHFVMCGGPRHAANLWVMERDGSSPRQLSFNCFNDFNPSVLPDGRIIYSRWEYNERSVTSLHNPFTVNPDGSMVAPFYGNATIRPNVVMFPRAVPGSQKVMGLFTAHHGQTHGAIGLMDPAMAMDGPEGITCLTPEVPITGEKAEDSRYGWYSDPVPLSESTYLCSYTPTVLPWLAKSWAIYVGDRHGNLALVYRDPAISCAEPVPLVSRPAPPALNAAPLDTDSTDAEARLVMLDVSRGLEQVPAGTVRYLRVLEDVPRKSVPAGGVILTSATSMYTVKRIVGTVPVRADGSAHFAVPANRNVYFEALDGDRREVQRMRSVVCLKPGEVRSCVGCHESRTTAPPLTRPAATPNEPSAPEPMPWNQQVLSYLRDVQPVLNESCIRCHSHDREASGVILTEDLTDQFCVSYEELVPYLSLANAMRWDNPEDVLQRAPYTYGSRVSPLMKLLDGGHYGVALSQEAQDRLATWVDANGVYFDRYESAYGDARSVFGQATKDALADVFERRCSTCHGGGDGQFGTWWMTLNWRDPSRSRALQAPLSRAAGGWGLCGEDVFRDTRDPDYQALLSSLQGLWDRLAQRPREDLLSLRGSEMAQNAPPPAPLPTPRSRPAPPPDDEWVNLTALEWQSAAAGWSVSGDGLPRRNEDIEGKPLALGSWRFQRGIGTHAPSEVTYALNGAYRRFWALVGGGESGGTVVFRVFGDERLLFDSGVMKGLRGSKTIDVPVEGVGLLRLVVTDAGDGINCDEANWADARLLPKAK